MDRASTGGPNPGAKRSLAPFGLIVLLLIAADAQAGEEDRPGSKSVIGPTNELLAAGATAMQEGRFEDGIRLTLAGLESPNLPRDAAAGHSNLCAAFAHQRRWDKALEHCNRALALDGHNWRTFNNRAAVYVGRGEYELAMADVRTGLELAPHSQTLLKSLEVVQERRRLHRERSRAVALP